MITVPLLLLVIGTALIGGVNPVGISVYTMIMSAILGSGKSLKRLVLLGTVFITTVFFSYLLLGVGLTSAFRALSPSASHYVSLAIGMLAVTIGLLEIKEYFWYGRWYTLQIPSFFANKIHEYSPRKSSVIGMKMLGLLVAVGELPVLGASYLGIITILQTSTFANSAVLLSVYNFVYALPLIFILIMVARGAKISTITKWKEESKGTMRLFMGLVLITLGWIILLIANGTINFG